MLIAFTLTMPGNNSWNGKWSGDDRLFVVIRKYGKKPPSVGRYGHSFGDGWYAAVTSQEVDSATARSLRKRSAGFSGYEWMIDSIEQDGAIVGRYTCGTIYSIGSSPTPCRVSMPKPVVAEVATESTGAA